MRAFGDGHAPHTVESLCEVGEEDYTNNNNNSSYIGDEESDLGHGARHGSSSGFY